MTHRVLFGGVWHETNSFLPISTDLEAFRRFQFVDGDELLTAYCSTNTEIGGFTDAAPDHRLRLIPSIFAGAVPSGLVTRAALDSVVDTICERAAHRDFDAVYLALHGAMVAEGLEEADAYVVQRVRQTVGVCTPIVATFDLHANLTPAIVEAADVLIGYDTLPHVDMAERGREAASIIARLLHSGERPRKAFRKLPLLTVPQMQATNETPMRDIMAECFAIERDPGILVASVAPGFAYTDVPHLGAAVLAYGDAADAAVQRLADALWSRREQFRPFLLSPKDAVARAMRALRGPFILSEPADNVGGGAPGDSTYILQALLTARATGASVVLWDPTAAAIAAGCGLGGHCCVTVGGKTHPLHGTPTEIEGTVGFAGRVRYRRDASYMTGQPVDLGLVARIDVGGVRVVLTTDRAMPMDKMHLRCVGIEPEREQMISVKCASAWRGAFGDIAADQCYVDTPGICSSNVERIPYTRLAKPLYPLPGCAV
jgi:microcystin degradation protein MlrC